MDKWFLVGSTYFFHDMPGFCSKDIDRLVLVDNPIGFKNVRQISGQNACLFEWRRMSADEFIACALDSRLPMTVGKFLVPEFCREIGLTIDHLKKLASVFEQLDDKHKYEQIIYKAYIDNNNFILTSEQKQEAYEVYKMYRKEVR